jgi:hypothetical protein
MVMMEAVMAGDGSIEFPSERVTFQNEQPPSHVFRRFDAQPVRQIPLDSNLSHQAFSADIPLTHDDYFRDRNLQDSVDMLFS